MHVHVWWSYLLTCSVSQELSVFVARPAPLPQLVAEDGGEQGIQKGPQGLAPLLPLR